MKIERSIFAQHGPEGFPNVSSIRDRLQKNADTSSVEFWKDGFDKYAKDVLTTVETRKTCSDNQANAITKECLIVASRRLRAATVK